MCKQKVVPSQGDSDSEESSPEDNEEVSESTPLLRSLASTGAHSFGTMSSASRSEQDSSEYEDEELDSSDSEEVTLETVVVQMQQPGCESRDQDLPRA